MVNITISAIYTTFDRPGWRFVVRRGAYVHTSGAVWWTEDGATAAGQRWATDNVSLVECGRSAAVVLRSNES